jgi:diguanylate cyclase (GGDEF)-like protein
MLLAMYKKSQYGVTRGKIQRLVMLMSAVGIAIGVTLTALLLDEPLSTLLYGGTLVVIFAAFLLQRFKVVSLNTATIIYFSFLCFIYTPINWFSTGGLLGVTPYLSVIVMLGMILSFSGQTQKVMKYAYLIVILACVIYMAFITPEAVRPLEVYRSVAFAVAISLTVYYMSFMFRKYDQMHDQFLRSSIRDELTRVLSRRVLDVIIRYVEKEYQTKGRDYMMVMMDVDKFKQLNDEYGHVVGDIVLRNTAKCIKEDTRESDFVVRYGGDEFLIVLQDVTPAHVNGILKRIESTHSYKRLLDFDITVSRGLAKRSECESPEALIALADQRMYEDKGTHR